MTDDLNRLRAVTLTDDERARLETWERDGLYACPHQHTCPSPVTCRERYGLFAEVESIVAARTAALIERAERAETERDELAQTMWDAWAVLGFDTDGDTNPRAWIAGAKSHRVFAEDWLRDIRQHRKDADEADAEWSHDIDRLDATVVELAALRAAVTNLADEAEKDGQGIYIDAGHTHVTAVETGLLRSLLAAAPTETEGENT